MKIRHIFLIGFFYPLCILAEFPGAITGTDASQDLNRGSETITHEQNIQNNSSNGNEAGVLRSTLRRGSDTQLDTQIVNSNGREEKANQAKKKAALGKAVAMATGAALMARGVPMAASILPPVKIAGMKLIAKAVLEFAQAGADAGAQSANSNQEGTLRNATGDTGTQLFNEGAVSQGNNKTKDEIKQKIDSPQLRQMLTNNGVNPDAFMDQVANGELNDFQSVSSAMGIYDDFSDEDYSQSEEHFTAAFDTSLQETAQLKTDELAGETGLDEENRIDENAESGPAKFHGSFGGVTANGSEIPVGVSGGIIDQGGPSEKLRAQSSSGEVDSQNPFNQGKYESGSSGSGRSLVSQLFGSQGKKQTQDILGQFSRRQLASVGIDKVKKLQSKHHIFSRAHRAYRSFNKWREKQR